MFRLLCQANIRNLFNEFVGTADNCTAETVFLQKIKQEKKRKMKSLIDEFITIKGIKAMGNQFAKDKVKTINITIPEPVEEN